MFQHDIIVSSVIQSLEIQAGEGKREKLSLLVLVPEIFCSPWLWSIAFEQMEYLGWQTHFLTKNGLCRFTPSCSRVVGRKDIGFEYFGESGKWTNIYPCSAAFASLKASGSHWHQETEQLGILSSWPLWGTRLGGRMLRVSCSFMHLVSWNKPWSNP